jgi:hypothetical protein
VRALLVIALLLAGCGGGTEVGLVGPSGVLASRGPAATVGALATEEPLATENLASDVPASDPPAAPELAVKVTKAPGSVVQGATATVTISTTKAASCDIDVVYYSGSSTAKGLETKTADLKGGASWKWLVGSKTTKGKWPVTISYCAESGGSGRSSGGRERRERGRGGGTRDAGSCGGQRLRLSRAAAGILSRT